MWQIRKILCAGVSLAVVSVALVGCVAGPPEIYPASDVFIKDPEDSRLRYFQEIRSTAALREHGVTGEGVLVTIMGEAVDSAHPDLKNRVISQYNAFVEKGALTEGEGNLPYQYELYGKNDGHGTHIAGTIAAECDGIGLQGVACGAQLTVYDLGAYDSTDRFELRGWGDDSMESQFVQAFTTSMIDVRQRQQSHITTGSFNIETPAYRVVDEGPLVGLSIDEIVLLVEKNLRKVDDLFAKDFVSFESEEEEAEALGLLKAAGGDPKEYALGFLLQYSTEWENLIQALADYQAQDGLYIVTESNAVFGDTSSLLNALPSLDERIDPDLWITVSMVMPDDIENAVDDEGNVTVSKYISPINPCGKMAADYCIVTPSYLVLSTMTERMAFWDGTPLLEIEGRLYQPLDGHSMGAPMVAAALALMQERNERDALGYSMKEMAMILKENANREFPGYDPIKHGRGMLDVKAALDAM